MRGPAQVAGYLGSAFIFIGFAVVGAAWNAAAEVDFVQGQLPYLLSGGLGGLAFILIGAGVQLIQALRTASAERARQMGELHVAMLHLADLSKPGQSVRSLNPTGPVTRATTPVISKAAAAPGHDLTRPQPPARDPDATIVGTPRAAGVSTATADRPDAAAVTAPVPKLLPVEQATGRASAAARRDRVIAGRASFHEPECRLVAGREDLPDMRRADAEDLGLAPCRVCKP